MVLGDCCACCLRVEVPTSCARMPTAGRWGDVHQMRVLKYRLDLWHNKSHWRDAPRTGADESDETCFQALQRPPSLTLQVLRWYVRPSW